MYINLFPSLAWTWGQFQKVPAAGVSSWLVMLKCIQCAPSVLRLLASQPAGTELLFSPSFPCDIANSVPLI